MNRMVFTQQNTRMNDQPGHRPNSRTLWIQAQLNGLPDGYLYLYRSTPYVVS